jgi:hypothetical protein
LTRVPAGGRQLRVTASLIEDQSFFVVDIAFKKRSVEEHSIVPLGEARPGRIDLNEWFRRSPARV